MRKDVLRIFGGLFLNALIILLYTWKFPPHPKLGYFFAEIEFGLAHIIIGSLVALVRVPPRSIFYAFTMSGNLLFTLYFFAFMIDYSEVQASILLVIPLLSLTLSFWLTYVAFQKLFQPNRESL